MTTGILAARARSTAGELASTSHGLRMMTSTFCAMKFSAWLICFWASAWASTKTSFTPRSFARAWTASPSRAVYSADWSREE